MTGKYDVVSGYDQRTYERLLKLVIPKKTGYMPLVYVCSPFSGDEITNMAKARVYSRFVLENNCIPICPHIYFPQFLFEATERECATRMNTILLGKCQEVWVFGENITAGMKAEIEKASLKEKMKIRYFSEEFKEKE